MGLTRVPPGDSELLEASGEGIYLGEKSRASAEFFIACQPIQILV